jgi:hypothetical protein
MSQNGKSAIKTYLEFREICSLQEYKETGDEIGIDNILDGRVLLL